MQTPNPEGKKVELKYAITSYEQLEPKWLFGEENCGKLFYIQVSHDMTVIA